MFGLLKKVKSVVSKVTKGVTSVASLATKTLGKAGGFREIATMNGLDIFKAVLPQSRIILPVIEKLAPGLYKDINRVGSTTLFDLIKDREDVANLVKGRTGYDTRLTKLEGRLGLDLLKVDDIDKFMKITQKVKDLEAEALGKITDIEDDINEKVRRISWLY